MTETTPDDARLKRLRMRSWRRGIKEMDLILGHGRMNAPPGWTDPPSTRSRRFWARTTTTCINGSRPGSARGTPGRWVPRPMTRCCARSRRMRRRGCGADRSVALIPVLP